MATTHSPKYRKEIYSWVEPETIFNVKGERDAAVKARMQKKSQEEDQMVTRRDGIAQS